LSWSTRIRMSRADYRFLRNPALHRTWFPPSG